MFEINARRVRSQVRNIIRVVRLLASSDFRTWGLAVIRERRNPVAEAQRAVWLRSDEAVGKHTLRAVTQTASKDVHADRLLAALVRSRSARVVIELGTNVGLSGTYLAAALPPDGRLVTVDQSIERQALARLLFESAGLADRIEVVTGTFREVAVGVASSGFDVAFVDGDHTYEATIWLVDMLMERAHRGSVIVVDDIKHSGEMRRAWADLNAREDLVSISLVDFGALEVRRVLG